MNKKIKAVLAVMTAALSVSVSGITASAAEEVYYYNVKKAADYALHFSNAEKLNPEDPDKGGIPESRADRAHTYVKGEHDMIEKITTNPLFIYNSPAGDCTNYVSQILYYGGYTMKGKPEFNVFFKDIYKDSQVMRDKSTFPFDFSPMEYTWPKGCTSWDENDWYYYKYKDNLDVSQDTYSSTWVSVTNNFPTLWSDGIYQHFKKRCPNTQNIGTGLKYDEVVKLAEEGKIKRGDILQMQQSIGYDHSMFIWSTSPEIRYVCHSGEYFAKCLSAAYAANPTATYRIITTTDHAVPGSEW